MPCRSAFVACASVFACAAPAQEPKPAQEQDDARAEGYARALLERELQLPGASVTVRAGVLTLRAKDLGTQPEDDVKAVLARVPGVHRVDVALGEHAGDAAPGDAARTAPPASFLSRSPLLFEPLLADPRWPHFSAAWQSWHASELESVGSVSFGESFTFYRAPVGDSAFDVGFQAAVFAIFDLEQESLDLVNADYLAGPVLAAKSGPVSALLRLIHQSSHLGDEYLLRTQATRVNLSYETVDLLVSWQALDTVRLYGGGGHIVHTETPLERWIVHGGVEFLAPASLGAMRPVAGVDVQSRQYTDWNVDLSVRAGVQFQDDDVPRGRVQLLLEYYKGSSPHGQFFTDEIEYAGVGLHFYF